MSDCLAHKRSRLGPHSICRSKKKYLQIEELSIDEITIWRLKNYWQIEGLSADHSAGSRSICGLKNYQWIEVGLLDRRNIWSADWRTICRSKKYTICRSNNYLQIAEISADRRTICRLKNDMWIKEVFNLQVEEISVGQRTICK